MQASIAVWHYSPSPGSSPSGEGDTPFPCPTPSALDTRAFGARPPISNTSPPLEVYLTKQQQLQLKESAYQCYYNRSTAKCTGYSKGYLKDTHEFDSVGDRLRHRGRRYDRKCPLNVVFQLHLAKTVPSGSRTVSLRQL